MRKLLFALPMMAALAFGQTQTYTYTYTGLPMPIYPDDWDTVGIISLFVPKSLAVTKVTVSVTVQYSGVGDLNVFMWSPAGTRTKLLERNCGSLQNINTTFDDAAATTFSSSCPAATSTGTYRGNEPLANSVNENAFGLWRLGVENNGSSKTGVVTGFTVSITGRVLSPPAVGPNTVVSTASFEAGSVSPGEQVSLIGVNLGPTDGVRSDASKNLPTSLSGTSVTFDGVAAPIYYVSDNLVAVQVPTTLTPGATTRIQVTAASGSSSAINLPVVPARPGIFTYEAGGGGQAKALNEDGSLNGDTTIVGTKPALPGTTLQIFTTGMGAVDPPIAQGTPAPQKPLSLVTLPVNATIGGVPATVTYAGAAPGMVGVYQVNVTIPLLTPSGANRLVITAGGNSSQREVTVQVR